MSGGTLCIDAGQSGCRLRIVTAGRPGRVALAPGIPLDVPPEEGLLQAVTPTLEPLVKAAGVQLDTIVAGVTGLHGQSSVAHHVLDSWGPRYGVRRVLVAHDALTGYLGALGSCAGAVVAGGTGAVALAINAPSKHARVDGLGHLLGDAGSGFWIGRRGLEEALRCMDGRRGSMELLRRAASRYGQLPALPAVLASSPNRTRVVASFTRDVEEAARAGDPVAIGIWADAGRLLAESAVAALRRVGLGGTHCPVSWTGALFQAGELLLRPFIEAVQAEEPACTPRPPRGEPLDGAALLGASARPQDFGSLVDTAGWEVET